MIFNTLTLISLLGAITVKAAPQPLKPRDSVTIIENCYDSGQVAMTFDDGPYIYESTVDQNMNGYKATFFLNGNNYDCIYNHVDEIRALHAAGHTLGSHTWSHPDLTTLSSDEINDELAKVELAFERILGLRPLYFRPPYGSYNDDVLSILGSRGYKKMFLWTDDAGDANGESLSYSENVYDGVVGDYPNPHLVLDHSTIETTAEQLVSYAVGRLTSAGYTPVAVDTCLGSSGEWPYEYISEPGTQDGSWTC